jgi:hypothetical protein
MQGGITIPGQITVGNSTDGVSSSISDSKYDGNSLCIIGQGAGPNRKVTMWDNVQINGKLSTTGITTGAIISDDWFRVKGQNGLFFQDGGGGWHMTDSTWIRAYNGKNVFCSAEIHANRMSTVADINVGGAVKAGSFCIGGTCIDETHLQMLTGARAMRFYQTEGGSINGDHRWIHVEGNRLVYVYNNPNEASYFQLKKQ